VLRGYKQGMNTNEEQYHTSARKIEDAIESQLFGKPCYNINIVALLAIGLPLVVTRKTFS